ncbi:hypothetical protein D8682_16840 [Buttiauxella sp. 3AFRM03]|jgi:hypothetical protein|nr:hypothetical protein D8682_16840 [Buttiauxella sp. 3AFRM03]
MNSYIAFMGSREPSFFTISAFWKAPRTNENFQEKADNRTLFEVYSTQQAHSQNNIRCRK